jgi:hypothetical protein
MRSSRRWGNKLAQINFEILAQDNKGSPLPGAMVAATCAELFGASGLSPYYNVVATNRDGIALFQIAGIIRDGPYTFQIQAFDRPMVGSITITVGIGNDTNTAPPYAVTLN